MDQNVIKLEEVKSLVRKKIQALESLEGLVDEVNKSDLNMFFGKVENINTFFNAFQSSQKDDGKEYAKIKNVIYQDQRKADAKRKNAKKGARTNRKGQMR